MKDLPEAEEAVAQWCRDIFVAKVCTNWTFLLTGSFFFACLHKPRKLINFVTFDESMSFSLIPLNIYYLISLIFLFAINTYTIIDKTIVNVSLNFENKWVGTIFPYKSDMLKGMEGVLSLLSFFLTGYSCLGYFDSIFLVFSKNWFDTLLYTPCNVYLQERLRWFCHIYVYNFLCFNCFTTLLFFSLSLISLGIPGCFVRQTYCWWQIQWSRATGSRSTNKVSSGKIFRLANYSLT